MITTHQRQMMIVSKAKTVKNLVDCGATLDQAMNQTFEDYRDRQEFCFILKHCSETAPTIDTLVHKVENRQDMLLAGVFFW